MEQHTRQLAVGGAAVVGDVDLPDAPVAPEPVAPCAATGGLAAVGLVVGLVPRVAGAGGAARAGARPREDRDPLRLRALALGVPYLHLPPLLPAECLGVLDVALARHLRAVPVGRSATALTVAFDARWDARALFRLRAATGLDIFPVLTLAREVESALAQLAV